MKVCLISINAKSFSLPPYGVWVLKAYLDKYSPEKDLEIDTEILSFSSDTPMETIENAIANANPDLVGLSHYIWNDSQTINLLKQLHKVIKTDTKVIIGGPHADRTDERLIAYLERGLLDAIVIGEGEKPLFHIVECISKGEEITPIDGIVCREEKGLNSYKPQVHLLKQDINFLPNPYQISDELLESSITSGSIQYETSRGCPFSCTFCDQGHKAYRSLTMERVKLDLSFFAAHKPKHIDFLDGTFNLSPKRTIELLNYLIEINESTGCTFHAEIKPELLTSEEIKLMKKANFTSVELGLQSIHTSTLKAIKRRNVWEKLEKSVENLLNEGIDVIVNTIIGLPGETLQLWYESLDYCFNLGRVRVLSNVLKILPNTVMSQQVEEFGFEYRRENFNAIESTNALSKEDLHKAIVINKLVNMFWNQANKPISIQLLTHHIYKDKFHKLLEDISDLLLTEPQLLQVKDFHMEVLNRILDNSAVEEEKKFQIKVQIQKDFIQEVAV